MPALLNLLALPLALGAAAPQAASPAPAPAPSAPLDLSALPVTQSAPIRCALAFAVVADWRRTGDARAEGLPVVPEAEAREFFVQALAQIIEARALDRDAVTGLVAREAARLKTDAGRAEIAAMMPACQMMKSAAGL